MSRPQTLFTGRHRWRCDAGRLRRRHRSRARRGSGALLPAACHRVAADEAAAPDDPAVVLSDSHRADSRADDATGELGRRRLGRSADLRPLPAAMGLSVRTYRQDRGAWVRRRVAEHGDGMRAAAPPALLDAHVREPLHLGSNEGGAPDGTRIGTRLTHTRNPPTPHTPIPSRYSSLPT